MGLFYLPLNLKNYKIALIILISSFGNVYSDGTNGLVPPLP
jgi:hypothetical protein